MQPTAFQIAEANNFHSSKVSTSSFEHIVFSRQGADDTLHVYLGGDGQPWRFRRFISEDPTPAYPLALHLMSRDLNNSVYIGRPCYFGLNKSRNCGPDLWTSHRYSEQIVTSMLEVLETIRPPERPVLLIGHSGGGALATLIASRLKGDISVITISSNLDIDAWTTFHNYLPLSGSLNPIKHAQLDLAEHFHFAGGKDSNVPSHHIKEFAELHGGEYILISEFDHTCCWLQRWQDLLASTKTKISTIR